jgi:branched-chain amino acid transport system substrate-binding protein
VTSFHYSASHDTPENKAFLKAYADANGAQGGRPNFVAVAAYDGMAAIAEVVKRLGGTIDGDKAMEILKGMRINSPRGPIVIDRETRDVVQTVYIRRVERVNGQLYNTEFEKFADVKDPGK